MRREENEARKEVMKWCDTIRNINGIWPRMRICKKHYTPFPPEYFYVIDDINHLSITPLPNWLGVYYTAITPTLTAYTGYTILAIGHSWREIIELLKITILWNNPIERARSHSPPQA